MKTGKVVVVNKCQVLPWMPDCQRQTRKRTTIIEDEETESATQVVACLAAAVGTRVCGLRGNKEARGSNQTALVTRSRGELPFVGGP